MMSDLIGKKLLILGANPETVPLVERANDMGIRTLVTSNRAGDPAKKHAWRAFDVDGLDVEGLVGLARSEGVDGVLVGVADILVPVYCAVCERLELPCYATRRITEIFSRKDTFKAFCERHGIRGIPEYHLDENMRAEDVERIIFPVMVKPVDSCSGLGMTVAYDVNELRAGVEKALRVSKSRRFLVEKYMRCDDMGLYYTFKDGYCSASCIYDRYTTDEQPGLSRVCLGGTYPSKHIDEYFEKMHEKALRMFRDAGIMNGVLMLSAFFDGNEFYVYDTGFRLQGEAPHILMKAIHGFDQAEMLIRFALTGSEGDTDLSKEDDARLRGKYAATLWFLSRCGKIVQIEGLDRWRDDPRVQANVQRLYEGDEVLTDWIGTEKQVLARLYLVCDDKRELSNALKYYMSTVRAFDEAGNDLLLKGFDPDEALGLK